MAAKPTTHVLMVTDMSGSMRPLAEDVRGGFNTYVEDLAKSDGRYRLTVCLFDTEFIPLCTAAKPKDTPRLDTANYAPRAMTALLDAVGKTVAEFEARTTLGEDDRVLVVVQTDGAENASTVFGREQVADLIKTREATGKWSFVFLGAGPDAWSQAGGLGFARANTVHTTADPHGTRAAYSGVTAATVAYAAGASGPEASRLVADAVGDEGHA